MSFESSKLKGLAAWTSWASQWGAHTAMLFAASHPDLVRRLVLLECYAGEGEANDHTAMGDYFRSWEVPFTTRESRKPRSGTLRSRGHGFPI